MHAVDEAVALSFMSSTLKRPLAVDETVKPPKKKARRQVPYDERPRIFIMAGADPPTVYVNAWKPWTCKDATVRLIVDEELRGGNETMAALMAETGGDTPIIPTSDDLTHIPATLHGVPVEQWGEFVQDDDCNMIVLCMGDSIRW